MPTLRSRLTLCLLASFLAAESSCDRTPPAAPAGNNKTVPTKRRRVPFDESLAFVVGAGSPGSQALENPPEAYGFVQTVQIGAWLQRDLLQGGSLVESRNGWSIRDGIYRLNVPQGGSMDPALRVDKFEPAENEVVCQLDVSMDKPWRFGERGFDNDKPIRLLGDQGNEFPAIGHIYVDADVFGVRYTPGTPLKGLVDLPEPLARSMSPGQRVKLVFRVTKGAVVTGLAIGDKVAIKWQPKFKVNVDQAPR